MSSLIQRFVAGRSSSNSQRQAIGNEGQAVSRADFDKLASTVNTMAKAIEGLIEDFDTVASPEKLQALVNSAFKGIAPAPSGRPPLALKAEYSFLAPKDDDDAGMRVNSNPKGRVPLALPADSAFLAPQGD